MLKLSAIYKTSLIEIINWNLTAYCSDENNVDEFKIRLNSLWDNIAFQKECDLEIDDRYVCFLKEAIENAKNYIDESKIAKTDIEALWDWIFPIYMNK